MPLKFIPRILAKIVLRAQKMLCREILILGDSHAAIFKKSAIRLKFPGYFFNVVSVGGATVSGLENPNSQTQALPRFLDRLKKSKAETVIVLLGEVDTGFVIFYRAEKYEITVSEALNSALDNYQKLISSLSKTHRVICMSAPLPTIKDGQDWGEIANARKDVKASQLERTKLTLDFNKGMREFCRNNHCEYLDVDDESIGSNGLVDPRLLNKNLSDHHYDSRAYTKMIIPKLQHLLKKDASVSPAGF